MARPTKYRNKPTVVDGIRFASQAEARRDAELKLLEKAGEITDLVRQPKFDLLVNGVKVCRYVGDWAYNDFARDKKGVPLKLIRVVEDKKGVVTPAFRIKFKLAKALHPEIDWRVT